MSTSHRALLALGVFSLASCSPSVNLEGERMLLRQADEWYTATANAGDVDGLTALYAEDATRYSPSGESTTGIEAMRAFAEGVAATPGFNIKAQRLALEVAASGDMGYTLNLLELSVTGPDGAPVVQQLRDFHIWRKEADGAWRIVEDIWQVLGS